MGAVPIGNRSLIINWIIAKGPCEGWLSHCAKNYKNI